MGVTKLGSMWGFVTIKSVTTIIRVCSSTTINVDVFQTFCQGSNKTTPYVTVHESILTIMVVPITTTKPHGKKFSWIGGESSSNVSSSIVDNVPITFDNGTTIVDTFTCAFVSVAQSFTLEFCTTCFASL